jgi:hypothetical protein
MFDVVHPDHRKSTKVCRIAVARIVIVLTVFSCCFSQHAAGDDKTARQRFVVEVSGIVRVNSMPTTAKSEISRFEITSVAEVVLALSSFETSASTSDAVFLLHSGQTCHLSIHWSTGSVESQTVFLSGQPCLELAAEATPVLTISAI